jgi:hypothetical protein
LKKHMEDNEKQHLFKSVLENISDKRGLFSLPSEMACKFRCGRVFPNILELYKHSEVCPMNGEDKSTHSHEESFMSDTSCHNTTSGGLGAGDLSCGDLSMNADERKVRVRTLISDEQLSVLKTHYLMNPRPKREDLEKIADQIGHPFKVVKVWFQNSRARDRREGKPASCASSPQQEMSSVPPPLVPFFMGGSNPLVPGLQQTGAFPFLHNNLTQLNAAALMAAGLLPRMGGLVSDLFANKTNGQGDRSGSPNSDSKSVYSSSMSDYGEAPSQSQAKVATDQNSKNTETQRSHLQGKTGSDQPLDLSNKGSSPSASPVSRKDDDMDADGALNLSQEKTQSPINLSW